MHITSKSFISGDWFILAFDDDICKYNCIDAADSANMRGLNNDNGNPWQEMGTIAAEAQWWAILGEKSGASALYRWCSRENAINVRNWEVYATAMHSKQKVLSSLAECLFFRNCRAIYLSKHKKLGRWTTGHIQCWWPSWPDNMELLVTSLTTLLPSHL